MSLEGLRFFQIQGFEIFEFLEISGFEVEEVQDFVLLVLLNYSINPVILNFFLLLNLSSPFREKVSPESKR